MANKNKPKAGISLHKWIALGGDPKQYKGIKGAESSKKRSKK